MYDYLSRLAYRGPPSSLHYRQHDVSSNMALSIPSLVLGLSLTTLAAADTYSVHDSIYSPPNLHFPVAGYRCIPGLVKKIDGTCAKPIVKKSVFLYNAPPVRVKVVPPRIPNPAIDFNYVFIKASPSVQLPKPIVVPPPQQKTLVYVLNKQPGPQQQQVIQVPSELTEPEVYFINYDEGENPTLPGGIDLKTALSQSAKAGNIVGDGSGLGDLKGISSDGFGIGGVDAIGDLHDSSEEVGFSDIASVSGFGGDDGISDGNFGRGFVGFKKGFVGSGVGLSGFDGSIGGHNDGFGEALEIHSLGKGTSLSSFNGVLSSSYGVPPSQSHDGPSTLSTSYGPPPQVLPLASNSVFVKSKPETSSYA
ncbi:protein of unknown function DUF243 [Trinorchestia longiramus]|nr:protein of unknown function DUF243 [Trinorchestia longiramus]